MYRLLLKTVIAFGIMAVLWTPGILKAQMRPTNIECGSTVQGELEAGEEHVFRLPTLYAGDVLETELVVGGWGNASWEITRSDGRRVRYDNSMNETYMPSGKIAIEAEDEYLIFVTAYGSQGGTYALYTTCTYVDGTVDAPESSNLPGTVDTGDSATAFTGFGFPGVAAVDFSAGIEIPLQRGQPVTVPVGGDVVLYTHEAGEASAATLSVERISGDISTGVTVIKRDTNEILFLAGLPSSDKLSVELNFPSEGVYAIGLFRLDTPERSNTSGAVQVNLE